MLIFLRRLTPFLLVFIAFSFIEAGITTDYSNARSRFGGRSFRRSMPRRKLPSRTPSQINKTRSSKKSGFSRGLAGGLLGGAIGGMLFGSMFGMGGSGLGIVPLLILGGVGYFLYRRFARMPRENSFTNHPPPQYNSSGSSQDKQTDSYSENMPPPVPDANFSLENGIQMIQKNDPAFDLNHFTEVASDVFFQIQAGWMRRDLTSYRHLLGKQLAEEYEKQFSEMKELGQINKLESIAIRKIEAVDAGSDQQEDFITLLFTANLLDYTVDDKSGDLIKGSMSNPVKFAEKWTWARPVKTEDWKLEGIEVINE